MQNTILDLMSWSKLLRTHARKTTSIEAKENLTNVADRLDEISNGLLTGKDKKGRATTPSDMGQALLRLWRVTNTQEWRFSTLNVLGDEGNYVSLILSLFRDTAENLLRGDYIKPDKPLQVEDLKAMMNPIGICNFCKKVIEAKAGLCPFCKKKVGPGDITEPQEDESNKIDFIKGQEIDYEKLAPSTIFLYNVKSALYECRKCGYAPFAEGKTKDPNCRDLRECPSCKLKEKSVIKGTRVFIAPKGMKMIEDKDVAKSERVKAREEIAIKEEKEKTAEASIFRGVSNESAWPCESRDPGRSACAKVLGPRKGKIKWTLKLGDDISAPVIVGADGNLYLGVHGVGMMQVLPSGKQGWIFRTEENLISSACFSQEGYIIFNLPKKTYKMNSDGTPRWMAREGADYPPALDPEGNIYVISGAELVCLKHDGIKKWSAHLGLEEDDTGYDLTPALGPEGNIYVSTDHLNAFNRNGESLFRQKLIKRGTHPSVDSKGIIYLGTENRLLAFNSDGRLFWQFELNDYVSTAPAVSDNDSVYFGTMREGSLYCISKHGNRKWDFRTGSSIMTTPTVDGQENIYFSNQDGKLFCLGSDGKQKWVLTNKTLGFIGGGLFNSSPAIGKNEILYVSCHDGKLYAIE